MEQISKNATIIANPSWVKITTPDGATIVVSPGLARRLAAQIAEHYPVVPASGTPILVENWPTRGQAGG